MMVAEAGLEPAADEAYETSALPTELFRGAGRWLPLLGSASAAIALIEQNKEIKVMFTDVQMPGTMDGIRLARYVRERWPPTIIVVSSGVVTLRLGALPDDVLFLAKPYDDHKLGGALAEIETRLSPRSA